MLLCFPASIVVFMVIIVILLDYELYGGFIPVILFTDLFISVILIALVQWFCSKDAMGVAWLTAISITVVVFYCIYLWRTNDPTFMKFIEDEKNNAIKKSQ